jgi:hypothetical protein
MSLNTTKIDASEAGPGAVDKAAPRTALATSGGALACAACCVLPVAFPAIALAGGGAVLVWIDAATKIMFIAALLAVVGAWAWIAYRARATGKRTAKATLVMMNIATAVLIAGLAFPLYEPLIVAAIKG